MDDGCGVEKNIRFSNPFWNHFEGFYFEHEMENELVCNFGKIA